MRPFRISVIARAIRHLRPQQLLWRVPFVLRRYVESRNEALVRSRYGELKEGLQVSDDAVRLLRNWLTTDYEVSPWELDRCMNVWKQLQKGCMSFLNVDESFDDVPAWIKDGRDRLWDLNLHYFDYAFDLARLSVHTSDTAPLKLAKRLVRDWMTHYPMGKLHGWDSYAVSLRVANWINLYCMGRSFLAQDVDFERRFLSSIFQQSRFLRNHIEYHLLGNHILENYRSLVLAGHFFDTPESRGWLDFALPRFLDHLDEQLLADGGHVERSPSYHCIVLDHVLDVIGLIKPDTSIRKRVEDRVGRMGSHLAALPSMEEHFPHFNDSASNICKPKREVLLKVSACGVDHDKISVRDDLAPGFAADGYAYSLSDTGIYVVAHGDWTVVFDGGPMGPDYQPSHAHCDVFSFWLIYKGAPVIVEGGTYGYYNDGEMREYCRSTRAHNTFTLDGRDLAEVWDVFRVGHRPHPRVTTWTHAKEEVRWSCEHDGFDSAFKGLTACRDVVVQMSEPFRISLIDYYKGGSGNHVLESYCHVAPVFDLRRNGATHEIIDGETVLMRISADADSSVITGYYCPEFGVKHQTESLKFMARGPISWDLVAVASDVQP